MRHSPQASTPKKKDDKTPFPFCLGKRKGPIALIWSSYAGESPKIFCRRKKTCHGFFSKNGWKWRKLFAISCCCFFLQPFDETRTDNVSRSQSRKWNLMLFFLFSSPYPACKKRSPLLLFFWDRVRCVSQGKRDPIVRSARGGRDRRYWQEKQGFLGIGRASDICTLFPGPPLIFDFFRSGWDMTIMINRN